MQLFERVKLVAEQLAHSQTALGKALGLSQGKFNYYLTAESEKNLWQYLPKILEIYPQIQRDWLWHDEGEMLDGGAGATGQTPVSIAKALPLVGLASCGVQGMETVMPFSVTVSPLVFGPRSMAVVASGESMVPAGIASGHICYCDPDQEALPGEAVFLQRTDGLGALKNYLGPGEREGSHSFRGWLPADDNGKRQEFTMEVDAALIASIAPVVMVRRRL